MYEKKILLFAALVYHYTSLKVEIDLEQKWFRFFGSQVRKIEEYWNSNFSTSSWRLEDQVIGKKPGYIIMEKIQNCTISEISLTFEKMNTKMS